MRTIFKYNDAICSCVYLIYTASKFILIQVCSYLLTRYFIIPVSVNECNLREVYTIAPREVRQMGNDDVRREMMTYVRT
jgi:hypothetical protein